MKYLILFLILLLNSISLHAADSDSVLQGYLDIAIGENIQQKKTVYTYSINTPQGRVLLEPSNPQVFLGYESGIPVTLSKKPRTRVAPLFFRIKNAHDTKTQELLSKPNEINEEFIITPT